MATQLQLVPARLQVLSSKLGNDRDIQRKINDIAKGAKSAAKSFKSAVHKEGGNLLLQKTLVMTGSAGEGSISEIQTALNAATDAFSATKLLVICLQTDIHSSIELCRGRKTHHESDLEHILTKLEKMWPEIESLEVTITTNEDEAKALSVQAVEINKRAEDMNSEAEKKKKDAETVGLISGIVGVALAPFTGGASLALATAASGISTAVNFSDAQDCENTATSLRNDAERKKRKAKELRAQKKTLMNQRSKLISEMRPVQSRTERLTEAASVLDQMTSFLLPTINALDVLVHVLQDLDTVIKEVSLENNSFEIIHSAFTSKANKPSSSSEKYMDKLREKWEKLEEVLLLHGAQDTEYRCESKCGHRSCGVKCKT